MCCTLSPSRMSSTLLLTSIAKRDNKIVHVMGYQNTAQNLGRGPNAMLLPFPAAEPMGAENILDTSSYRSVLSNMASHFQPRSRRVTRRSLTKSAPAQVFDSGAYTVVLAQSAADIPEALARVPAAKRPALNQEIFNAYARWYPGWQVALCCFDGAIEASPLLWWYVPQDATSLFFPALDAHDGDVPDLGTEVMTDHTLMWGSNAPLQPYWAAIEHPGAPAAMEAFLPTQIRGCRVQHSKPNGDWRVPVPTLFNAGHPGAGMEAVDSDQYRVLPPGA